MELNANAHPPRKLCLLASILARHLSKEATRLKSSSETQKAQITAVLLLTLVSMLLIRGVCCNLLFARTQPRFHFKTEPLSKVSTSSNSVTLEAFNRKKKLSSLNQNLRSC